MAVVRIQFSAAADIGSLLIREFEHGAWSHVDIVEPTGNLYGARSDVCMGVPSGVQSRPPGYTIFSATKVVEIETTDDKLAAFWDFLNAQHGKPYDSMAILSFVVDRNWRTEDAWYCSEILAAALEAAGILPHKIAVTANKVTPGDAYLVASVLTNVWAP